MAILTVFPQLWVMVGVVIGVMILPRGFDGFLDGAIVVGWLVVLVLPRTLCVAASTRLLAEAEREERADRSKTASVPPSRKPAEGKPSQAGPRVGRLLLYECARWSALLLGIYTFSLAASLLNRAWPNIHKEPTVWLVLAACIPVGFLVFVICSKVGRFELAELRRAENLDR